jgi:hypothetical protein
VPALAVLLAWAGVAAAQADRPATLLPPAGGITRTDTAQLHPAPAAPPQAKPRDPELQLGLPTCDQLYRPESEATARQRIRAEARRQGYAVEFPGGAAAPALPGEPPPRCAPPQAATLVPSVVCHRPLYFEDRPAERYGEYVPLVQPFLSTGKFYLDTLLLPYHLVARPPWGRECEAEPAVWGELGPAPACGPATAP